MKTLTTLFFFIILAFSNLNPAFSQTTASGFTLSPPFKEIELKKEASQSSYFIEITNNTPAHQTLFLSVVDFGSLDESGGVAFLGTRPEILERKYSLASWVTLEKDVLELEAQKPQRLKVTIVNKESLSPGGHYAAVVATSKPLPERKENNILLSYAFASLIFAKKIGGEKYQLDLVGKEVQWRWFSIPKQIRLRFQNSGNVHLIPRGVITIADPAGRLISKGIFNQESSFILPETFRIFPVELQTMKLPFIPGRYQLMVKYRYQGKEDYQSVEESFFFIGIPSTVTFIFAASSLYLLSRRLMKK